MSFMGKGIVSGSEAPVDEIPGVGLVPEELDREEDVLRVHTMV